MELFLKNRFVLMTSLARSYDYHHVSTEQIHLVASIFYVNNESFLNHFNLNFNKYKGSDHRYLILFTSDNVEKFGYIQNLSTEYYSIYYFNLVEFLKSFRGYVMTPECHIENINKYVKYLNEGKFYNFGEKINYFMNNVVNFESLLETFIGKYTSNSNELNRMNLLKSTLFLFIDMDWERIQIYFNFAEIQLSGGSITKRQLLSSSQFNLVKFLTLFGFDYKDVYESFRSYSSTRYKMRNSNFKYSDWARDLDNTSIIEKIAEIRIIIKDKLMLIKDWIEITKGLNLDLITKIFRVIQSIEESKSHLNRNNNNNNVDRIEDLDKKLVYYFKKVRLLENEIKILESKSSDIDLELKWLNEGKYEWIELKEKYYKYYYNIDKSKEINLCKRYIFETYKQNFKLGNFQRSYSTLSYRVNYKTLSNNNLSVSYYSTIVQSLNLISSNLKENQDKDIKSISLNENKLESFNDILNNKEEKVKINFKNTLEKKKVNVKKLNFHLNSPIYIELQRILSNSKLDDNTQLKIEQFLNNQGVLLLKNRINQSLDINFYKLNSYVLDSLKNSITELEKLIDNYKKNIKSKKKKDNIELLESIIIIALNNEEIISHLLGRLLRIISNNHLSKLNSCTELACDLGQSLLYQFYSNKFKKSEFIKRKDYGLSQFIKDNWLTVDELATDTVLIQIGFKLLNYLEEVNLIHSELIIINKDHKNYIYICNDVILNKISNFINLYSLSYKIPMIVKPKEYGRDLITGQEKLGGYLLNDKEMIIPMIIKNYELKEQSVINDKNIIYSLVNNLSSVGYKINTLVLDFILEEGLKYELFTDPNFIHPLEQKKKENKKLTRIEQQKLESFISRKQLEMNILGLALIFKNVPEFYIPVRIDNRGRVYSMVDYLNYQGIELAKALLLFSKSEKILKYDIESIKFLKIFGANCYGKGLEKKSYEDRVEWVNKNQEEILNFKNGKLIKEADSKLLFIAFCFEYINYYNSLAYNDTFYMSNFPIQLDATCNGYQHLSLLSGDEALAGELNLISNENLKPKDFYNYIALNLNDYLKQSLIEAEAEIEFIKNQSLSEKIDLQNQLDTIESYKRLLKLDINRKLVKLPIMVKPYNASLFQIVNYIKEQFDQIYNKESKLNECQIVNEFSETNFDNAKDIKNQVYFIDNIKNVKLTNKDLFLFGKLIDKVIYNEFPKLKELNNYLKKVAEICCLLNITITWAVPSGLNVNQFYVDSEAIRLKPFKFRKNTLNLKIKSKNLNKAKQIRALMPNLVHSLDAASLALLVEMFSFNNESTQFNFFSIHDCFAMTANNIQNLIKFIKLVYIKIYSENSYLKKFDRAIIDSIKLQFGNEAFNDETKKIKVNGFNINYPNVDEIIEGKIKASQINNAKFIVN